MIGLRIREARQARGMTQATLAKGISSRTYISAIELGRVKPSAENLRQIAERLGEPLSHFLPDSIDEARQRVETTLNQAKGLLAAGMVAEARELLSMVTSACTEDMPTEIMALYHELQGDLEQLDGAMLQSALSYTLASDAYLKADHLRRAWTCRYTAAFALYQAGHMEQAISLGVDAAKLLCGSNEGEAKALTHYIIGCAYFAKGDVHKASTAFASAKGCAEDNETETNLRALLGECSCKVRQGEWRAALNLSRKAVALAEKHNFFEMQAEALIAAMACSVRMGEYEKAKQMLAQVSSLAGLPISTKCKAYREMLLVTKEVLPLEDTACLESTLGDLLQSDGAHLETWDVLKSQWALEKCRLLRDPQAALAQVESFAREFCNLERLKDASDVLAFGAELLQNTGATRDAYSLLGRAYALLQGNKTPRA